MSNRYLGGFITASYNTLAVPSAPTSVTAVKGNTLATISFTAPSTNAANVTSYTVTSNPGNITASGTSSPIIVTGLTNGTAYTFTVTPNSNYGEGTVSASSNSVTPNDPSTSSSLAASVSNGDGGSRYTYNSTSVSGGNGVFPIGTSQQFSFEYFLYMTADPGGNDGACQPCANGAELNTRNGECGMGGFGYSGSTLNAMGIGVNYQSGVSFGNPNIGKNAWYHVLWTRDGSGVCRGFVNGVLLGSTSTSFNFGPTSAISISRQYGNGGYPYSGYISNVRSCLGSIPTSYQTSSTTGGTTIFTVPSSALTTTSQGATAADVQLLVLVNQSNPLTDYSGKGRNLSLVGSGYSTMSTTTFSPFA